MINAICIMYKNKIFPKKQKQNKNNNKTKVIHLKYKIKSTRAFIKQK